MIRMTMRPTKGRLALALVASFAGGASANYDKRFDAKNKQMAQLQELIALSPVQVLESLDEYEQFWVEAFGGSCVWSECAIDDTDDAYMGDNRDGDEQWYQYRTQNFCANAAYSLYGRKKGESVSLVDRLGGSGCSRKHYINSYFTYGGADTLLKNLGVKPKIYYSDDDDDGQNAAYYGGNGTDDDYAMSNATYYDYNETDEDYRESSGNNAYCVELEGYDPEEAQEEEGRKLERQLSGSNDNGGYSSTMGCSTNGDYVISVFETNSCDGNYFLENVDTFDSYNSQHAVGCQQIMKSDGYGTEVSNKTVTQLLSNSWTCDVRMYPRHCPDPFGQKKHWEYALRSAARGGNPMWAYKNMVYKRPIKVITTVIAYLSVAIFALAYFVKNRNRIRVNCAHGRRGLFEGSLKVMKDNVEETAVETKAAMREYVNKQRAALKKKSRTVEEDDPADEEGESSDQQSNSNSWRCKNPQFDFYGNPINKNEGVMA